MKLSSLPWLLLLGAAARVTAQDDDFDDDEDIDEGPPTTTYFDGKAVPPMMELTPDNFDKEVNVSKYLLIKHYR